MPKATAILLTATMALPAMAEEHEATAGALFEALAMPEMIRIMSIEGSSYGDAVGESVFGAPVPQDWAGVISGLYDPASMEAEVRMSFDAALDGQDVGPMLDFFTSDLGAQIVGLELSAREALLDDDLEEAAQDAAVIAMVDETPRYMLVQDFVDTNDLIESNVVAALNSNVAFMFGMVEAGPLNGQMSEEQILTNVFSQEPEIRQNTTEWVLGYLMMAYEPLSDDDLRAYIEFSESDAGIALNFALFRSFDGLYDRIAREMGRAAGARLMTEEL